MEELKRKWFQIVWAGLLLCSLVINYIMRYANAAWAQSHAMEVLSEVLGWIVLPMTVILFVLHCVENWRIGERYFWRKWLRWGRSLFLGTLMAAVVLLVIRFVKSGGVLEKVLPENWFNIFLFAILAVGGFVYMLAKYKYNHPKRG